MKKALGVVMLIFSLLLLLPVVIGMLKLFSTKKNSPEEIGFFIGYLGGQLGLLAIVIALLRYGMKFLNEEKK